jgi:DNA helicase-2/ATP-dependent DNA helicase PcrA
VGRGPWASDPPEGEENPRDALSRSLRWPLDPLGERRPDVVEGAELVAAAWRELAAEPDGGAGPPIGPGPWEREIQLLLAERDAARAAGLTLTLPPALSASWMVALARDPGALARRLRRPLPAEPSPLARRGSAFHAWLEERYGAAALVDVDELPGAVDDDLPADEDLAVLQKAFLDSEWAARTAAAVEVGVEIPVGTPTGPVMLRGRIDAVFARPDGGWDVVDWKTGRPPGQRSAATAAVQLAIYRLAWARLEKVPVERVSAAFFYAAAGRTVRPVDLLDAEGLQRLLVDALTR